MHSGYLAGASGQPELRQALALGLDAIYKPLRNSPFTVLTWDFRVSAKYYLAKLGRPPFREARPSFRAAGNLHRYDPSHYATTVGAGRHARAVNPIDGTALYLLGQGRVRVYSAARHESRLFAHERKCRGIDIRSRFLIDGLALPLGL